MFKKSIIILFCSFPLTTLGAEFEFSLGGGFQYSGVIGTQFAVKHLDSKYFVSFGLPGYSIGMQTMVSDDQHHSVGFSLGKIHIVLGGVSQYGFITYNYHMDSFKSNGWVLGTGVGFFDEGAHSLIFGDKRINPSKKAMVTLDIGYKF